MPSLACSTGAGSAKARPATKRDMVNPMPPSQAAPYRCRQVTPGGRAPQPARTASQAARVMPACLPRTRPAKTPRAIRPPSVGRRRPGAPRRWPGRTGARWRRRPRGGGGAPGAAGGSAPPRRTSSRAWIGRLLLRVASAPTLRAASPGRWRRRTRGGSDRSRARKSWGVDAGARPGWSWPAGRRRPWRGRRTRTRPATGRAPGRRRPGAGAPPGGWPPTRAASTAAAPARNAHATSWV